MNAEAWINVQCVENATGKVGTFLSLKESGKPSRTAISPVFAGLAELYAWMRRNGWRSAEWDGERFSPWRVEKPLCPACGEPYDPHLVPLTPYVPAGATCACCCQS